MHRAYACCKSIGSRPTQSLLTAIIALAVASVIVSTSDARQIYVPTSLKTRDGIGSVNVIESSTNRVAKTIDIGPATVPVSATITPDGTRAYVLSTWREEVEGQNSFVSVVNTETNETVGNRIELPFSGPGSIASSPDGNYVFVASGSSSMVSVIETATSRVVRVALFDEAPDGLRLQLRSMAVSADGERLYISGQPVGPEGDPGDIDPESRPGVYVLRVDRIFNPSHENENCIEQEGSELCLVRNAADEPIEIGQPFGISLAPDGTRAWVGSLGSDISILDLGSSTMLGSVAADGQYIVSTAVNSDASRLYVGSVLGGPGQRGGGGVIAYRTSPLGHEWTSNADHGVVDITVMPGGDRIYYSNMPDGDEPDGKVSAVTDGGGVITPDGISVGGNPNQLAITPNQGPRADLRHEVEAGGAVRFDASGSSDSDGFVAQYVWDFGDGIERTTDTPTTSHSYANPGRYTASVRVIDNEGGSTGFISTGRTAMHNGSDAARASVSFEVEAGEQSPGPGSSHGPGGSAPGGGPGNQPAPAPSGTGVGGAGGDDDRCARPRYKLKVTASRYVRTKDLKKGLKAKITSTHKSKADIKVSLRRKDINRLGLYRRAKKKKTVGTKKKISLAANKERQVKVRITSKLLKVITRKHRNRVRLKIGVVSRATGVPRWRKMERRVSLSASVKRKGKAGKRQVSRTAKVRAISPCAKRLKVKLKAARKARTRKALKLQITSSAPATGTVELFLRGSDRANLKLSRSLSRRIYRAKVKLSTLAKLKKRVRLKSKTRRRLFRAMRSRGIKTARAKLVVKLKGRDGQRVRKAKTIRLKR